ncbi:MAG: hypothetical protein JXA82_08425 [Sedimentisphaerales bacterium]|nr:hypothetical protein [Sedimentisphaerales bacterium]
MSLLIELLNAWGEAFIALNGPMLLQSSILIAFLFGLDWVLRKQVRAVFRYWLWILILIKLILPPTLSAPYSARYWIGKALDPLVDLQNEAKIPKDAAGIPTDRTTSDAITSDSKTWNPVYIDTFPEDNDTVSYPTIESVQDFTESASGKAVDFVPEYNSISSTSTMAKVTESVTLTRNGIFFSLWVVACTGLGILVLQRTWAVRRLASQSRKADSSLMHLLESCRKRMDIRQNVNIRITSALSTPGVYGIFRPVILIPLHVRKRMSMQDLEVIVVHELAHVQRGDLWIKLLQTILQVVYFYNPLLWLANTTIRKIREQAVDETVLVILGKQAGMQYPHTLIQVAKLAFDRPVLGLRLIGVMESKGLLTERIKIMVHKPNPQSARLGLVGLTILTALAVFLLPMARAQNSTAPAKEVKVESPPPSQSAPASSSPGVVIKDDKSAPLRVEWRLMTTAAADATEDTPPTSEELVQVIESEVSDEALAAELEQERQELNAMKQQIEQLRKQLNVQLKMMSKKEQYLAQKERQLFENKFSPPTADTEKGQQEAAITRELLTIEHAMAARDQAEAARKQMEDARKQIEKSRDLMVYEQANVVRQKAKEKEKELIGRNSSGVAVSVQEAPVVAALRSSGINESSIDTVNKLTEATSAAVVQVPATPPGVVNVPVPVDARTVITTTQTARRRPVSISTSTVSPVPSQDISSEVREALQEILPGLLEEMLPRIIQETMIKMEQKSPGR